MILDLNKIKQIYLAGGIQAAAHPNSWRNLLTDFFNKEFSNIIVFNPVEDNSNIFHPSIMGRKDDGNPYSLGELQNIDELKEALLLRQTEINDKQAIKKSDVIIFYLDDRIGFGTKTEFSWCYEWKKPMIIIRTIPRRNLAHWVKWRRYYALVIERFALEFKSLTDFQNYMLELKKEDK